MQICREGSISSEQLICGSRQQEKLKVNNSDARFNLTSHRENRAKSTKRILVRKNGTYEGLREGVFLHNLRVFSPFRHFSAARVAQKGLSGMLCIVQENCNSDGER